MTLKNRLQKLATKLKPEEVKIYYMGWADCTWSQSEGLFRQSDESKEDFCNRVYQTTKKQFLWFD
jgi:imidazoleglycerol phosphate synthase glutamine amidotransferase subunit HisH